MLISLAILYVKQCYDKSQIYETLHHTFQMTNIKINSNKIMAYYGILHAFSWKYNKLSNSGISLNWSISDEIATRNKTANFFVLLTWRR